MERTVGHVSEANRLLHFSQPERDAAPRPQHLIFASTLRLITIEGPSLASTYFLQMLRGHK
jgi:hypothetical protein